MPSVVGQKCPWWAQAAGLLAGGWGPSERWHCRWGEEWCFRRAEVRKWGGRPGAAGAWRGLGGKATGRDGTVRGGSCFRARPGMDRHRELWKVLEQGAAWWQLCLRKTTPWALAERAARPCPRVAPAGSRATVSQCKGVCRSRSRAKQAKLNCYKLKMEAL